MEFRIRYAASNITRGKFHDVQRSVEIKILNPTFNDANAASTSQVRMAAILV